MYYAKLNLIDKILHLIKTDKKLLVLLLYIMMFKSMIRQKLKGKQVKDLYELVTVIMEYKI